MNNWPKFTIGELITQGVIEPPIDGTMEKLILKQKITDLVVFHLLWHPILMKFD